MSSPEPVQDAIDVFKNLLTDFKTLHSSAG